MKRLRFSVFALQPLVLGVMLCGPLCGAASERQPHAANASEETDSLKLFDGKTLDGWKIAEDFDFLNHGKIEVADGAIVLHAGRPGSAIYYGTKLPTMDYEISLKARRVAGEDFFCGLTFMVGKEPLTLIVGGWNGEVVGLSCINGEPAVENETCHYQKFELGRWYSIRVRVTENQVTAWIDHDQVVDCDLADKELSIWFEPETVTPLGIATWRTTGAVKDIQVRRLKPDHAAHRAPAETND
ncbi:MAG: 3-keto-disaccharide hydrolase [Planctomycetota bacterium]